MTYALQEQYTSKNQVAGSAADSVWHRGARRVTSITIHHWGLKGQQFDTVRDFLCTNNTPTSAHYVAQDGLVACIVSPDDCAFHAGSAEGNTFSIGIECRPEATDGDYATVAELIAYLRGVYGDIPLYPHNHWYNTACPGDYDLDRLDSLARGTTISTQSATITPAEEEDMALSDDDLNKIYNRVWFGGAGLPLIQNRRTGQGAWPETFLGSFEARVQNEILAPALAALPAVDVAKQLDAAGIASQVRDELVKLLDGK